ncbi:hypothetical protein E2C01_092524 [Portunus trituberculatus]|uniref:Uncharacterized protein n=1 Tax=Portunus trituberculatus TaxID=210409 RepID=A0A5B7JGP1_PORTR|nr:hypothetical protein [Portunus trituberculatus]
MPCCRTSYSPPLSHRRLATAPFTLSSSYLPAHLPSSALSSPTYNPTTAQPQPSHPPTHTALPPPDPPGAGLVWPTHPTLIDPNDPWALLPK